MEHDEAQFNFFQFYDGSLMGVKDIEDNIIVPAIYDFANAPSDGLIIVNKAGVVSAFSLSGEKVFQLSDNYESCQNFQNGFAVVRDKNKDLCGYIDKTGAEVIAAQFHFAEGFVGEHAVVRNSDGLHGIIDRSGTLTCEARYPQLYLQMRGYAIFGDLQTFGLINVQGDELLPQAYVGMDVLEDGRVRVVEQAGDHYREGIYTLGGDIAWNNNMDAMNAKTDAIIALRSAFEASLEKIYQTSCACARPRILQHLSWRGDAKFEDMELLWSALVVHLKELSPGHYQCPSCQSEYREDWQEYSAFHAVMAISHNRSSDLVDISTQADDKVPFLIGFAGHQLPDVTKTHRESNVSDIISWLEAD